MNQFGRLWEGNFLFEEILFLTSALATCGGAVAVIVARNLIHACVYLLVSLFGVAGLYASLGADFLAATQLVVYAGGVVILMLFAVMLTGGTKNSINRFGLAKVAGLGSLRTFVVGLFSAFLMGSVAFKVIVNVISLPSKNPVPYEGTVKKIGTLLATDYVLAFEISSILLLGALIGAAVIARPRGETTST